MPLIVQFPSLQPLPNRTISSRNPGKSSRVPCRTLTDIRISKIDQATLSSYDTGVTTPRKNTTQAGRTATTRIRTHRCCWLWCWLWCWRGRFLNADPLDRWAEVDANFIRSITVVNTQQAFVSLRTVGPRSDASGCITVAVLTSTCIPYLKLGTIGFDITVVTRWVCALILSKTIAIQLEEAILAATRWREQGKVAKAIRLRAVGVALTTWTGRLSNQYF